VVNPGARYSVNPYYLGYTVLVDIEKRWDQLYAEGESKLTGREKLFEVRRTEDDISFLRNYLTTELVEKLQLFSYGNRDSDATKPQASQSQDIVITSRERDNVIEALISARYNYGVPFIRVADVVKNELYLDHVNRDVSFLDRNYANQTLAYIAELWKYPVHLKTGDEKGQEVTLMVEP
jgi:stage V sporulation protein R